MAKFANDGFMDLGLSYVRANCNSMIACTAQPTTYTEATSTYALADVAMTVNTDYTLADGDTTGRKITVAAKTGVLIDTSGTATHVALVSTGDTTLRYVTTCTSQALTAGGGATVDFPTWKITIADPT
jgi:hypothetical protein